ncbi:hypothetical protein [Chryseobacterium sp.]|uniref:hypothetical protein n=1 Tax=Chryseobacterium sp. TaxID=1871047 RepID=UPI002896740A|nr:hypothetical protein [Chryseobacterium sp.]
MSLTSAKTQFVIDLVEIFDTESEKKDNPAASRQAIAEKLANAVDKFVRSGDVNVTVATTGTAAAQTGTGTGKMT